MLHRKSTVIRSKICAVTGVVTDIHWGDNQGVVDLGNEVGKQDCTFLYMGQHWIYNVGQNENENAAAHSAFAFCKDDHVVVISQPLPPEEVTEESSRKYTCVAILSEDGNSYLKRYCWPLYRIGHSALILGAEYSDEPYYDNNDEVWKNKECGFPFIDWPTRELTEPFSDMKGFGRALGTFEPQGVENHNLVITRENNNFIPHAPHEFMSDGDQFLYVPDILMQTEANYKGRIVGYSADDEILIDNIPVAKVDTDYVEVGGSWRKKTHKLIHIDDENDIITVLFVTMDFFHSYYVNHYIYQYAGYLPPPFCFTVYVGQLSGADICIYKAMSVARDSVPVISLVLDEDASWEWDDMVGEETGAGTNEAAYCFGDMLSSDFDIGYFGQDVELEFYAITMNPHYGQWYTYIPVTFTLNTNEDGTYHTVKSKGDENSILPYPNFKWEVFLYWEMTPTYYETETWDFKVGEDDMNCVVGRSTNNTIMKKRIEAEGSYEYYMFDSRSPDWLLTRKYDWNQTYAEIFTHEDKFGSFEIARCVFDSIGHNYLIESNAWFFEATGEVKFVFFTHIDVANGIYAYWEMEVAPEGSDLTGFGSVWSQSQSQWIFPTHAYPIIWRHYVVHRGGKELIRQWVSSYSSGWVTSMNDIEKANAEGMQKLLQGKWLGEAQTVTPGSTSNVDYNQFCPCSTFMDFSKGGPASSAPGIPYLSYERFVKWLWDTDSIHITHSSSPCASADYRDFSLSPFGTGIKKKTAWPVLLNSGSPHLGNEAACQYAVESAYSPHALFFSRSSATAQSTIARTGLAYGNGQYKFVYMDNYGNNATIESEQLPALLGCTGRTDMILTVE